jgi:hypothetical protein
LGFLSEFAFIMRRRIPSFVKDPGFNGWSCVTFYPSIVSLRAWRSFGGKDKVCGGESILFIFVRVFLYGDHVMSTSLSISKEKGGENGQRTQNDLYFHLFRKNE